LFADLGDSNWISKLQHLDEALNHKLMEKVTAQEPHKDFHKPSKNELFQKTSKKLFKNSKQMCIQVINNSKKPTD